LPHIVRSRHLCGIVAVYEHELPAKVSLSHPAHMIRPRGVQDLSGVRDVQVGCAGPRADIGDQPVPTEAEVLGTDATEVPHHAVRTVRTDDVASGEDGAALQGHGDVVGASADVDDGMAE